MSTIQSEPVSSVVSAEKDGLVRLVKGSLMLFWRVKWRLLKAFLMAIFFGILVVGGLLIIGALSKSSMVMTVLIGVSGVALVILSLMYYGAVQRQAFLAYTGGVVEERVWKSCKIAVGLTFRAIYLALKIFLYSGAWAMLLVLICFIVMNTTLSAGYFGGANLIAAKVRPVESSQTTIGGGKVDTANAADSAGQSGGSFVQGNGEGGSGFLSGSESESLISSVTGGQTSDRATILIIGNFVLAGLGLLTIIIALIRSVWASLAFPFLFANPEISAGEALDLSVKVTKGKWWLIVVYSLAFSIALSIISGVMNFLVLLMGQSIFAILMLVVMAVVALAFAMLQLIFKQIFAIELKTRGEEYHL